ncbi:MAG: iron-containing alcohol dehydrogenase [Desulfobacteraceae bacterium]|nr:iron-containing alcohol dehydrogenase [Desulfobacteraceae bacterium]
MHIPDYYEFCCRVNIVTDHHALEKIPELLLSMGAKNPMVLTDKGVQAAGLIDIVIGAIDNKLSIKTIEDQVPPDSDLKIVNRLACVYHEKGCDAIIAVGGGSVLDTAKGINILVSEQAQDLMQFTGAGVLKQKLKPLIAVPTTAGTGSEVTSVAVIADHEKNLKMLFTSPFLLPDTAIIDPRMTLTLPPHITAATAMDAMAHAVEAYVMLSKNPLSDAHAIEAIKLICHHLVRVIKQPSDKKGRLALATAATMAGIAFSNSTVGMVHALGHSMGSVCHLPHGNCMAILLPYGLEYNLHKVEDEIAELLLPLAGEEIYACTPQKNRALKAIACIRELNQILNKATGGTHPICFKNIKDKQGNFLVTKKMLPEIARTAMGDGTIFYNPEDLDYEDCLMTIQAAWEGIPLDRSKIKQG